MIAWFRKKIGLCAHDWKYLGPIMSATGYDRYYEREIPEIQLGEIAQCRLCGEKRKQFYPDGH